VDLKQTEKDKNEEQAALFAAFSDPTRLRLIMLLAHQDVPGALCVNALAGVLGVSQSAVSQHLRVLKNIGLVSGERQGYRVHYALNHAALKRCHEIITEVLTIGESD